MTKESDRGFLDYVGVTVKYNKNPPNAGLDITQEDVARLYELVRKGLKAEGLVETEITRLREALEYVDEMLGYTREQKIKERVQEALDTHYEAIK